MASVRVGIHSKTARSVNHLSGVSNRGTDGEQRPHCDDPSKKLNAPGPTKFFTAIYNNRMPTAILNYDQFIEMFEPSQDFSGYEDDEGIDIQWKTVPCKNPAREASGYWCAFLWKPASEVYLGKWIRQEYNGSSPFAMWWCQESDYEEDD